jgi:predicted DNA-binding transcriptional regulator AlpA
MSALSPNDLTALLNALRDRGNTVLDLANTLGVSRITIYAWINQTRFPHPSQQRKILRLAAASSISVAHWTTGSNVQHAVGFGPNR